MPVKEAALLALETYTEHTVRETGMIYHGWQLAYNDYSTGVEVTMSILLLGCSAVFLLNLFCVGLRFKRINGAVLLAFLLYSTYASVYSYASDKIKGTEATEFKDGYATGNFYVNVAKKIVDADESPFRLFKQHKLNDKSRNKLKKRAAKNKDVADKRKREIIIFGVCLLAASFIMYLAKTLLILGISLVVAIGARSLYVLHFSETAGGTYFILLISVVVALFTIYFARFVVDLVVAVLFGFISTFYGMSLLAILFSQKDMLNEMWIGAIEYSDNDQTYPEEYMKYLIILGCVWFISFGLNMVTRESKNKV